MEGFIIKNISNDYTVKSRNNIYICKPRGKLRNIHMSPVVGDYVEFDEKEKYILEIKSRKNKLVRPNVANVDQAFIVTSAKEPDFNTVLLDKLLTIISYHNIKPIICLTKMDLLTEKEKNDLDKMMDYYERIGYVVLSNNDKKALIDALSKKVTVYTGQSGAGKSSLLNFLNKDLTLKTGEISHVLGRGKHTTRHTELFSIGDGFVVDTPGFSSVDFNEMTNIDIRDNMNEMFDNLEFCKYRDCMHLKEDHCAVKKKVQEGAILSSRYENYQSFLERKK